MAGGLLGAFVLVVFIWLVIITLPQLHVDRRWVAFVGCLLGIPIGILIHKFILPF